MLNSPARSEMTSDRRLPVSTSVSRIARSRRPATVSGTTARSLRTSSAPYPRATDWIVLGLSIASQGSRRPGPCGSGSDRRRRGTRSWHRSLSTMVSGLTYRCRGPRPGHRLRAPGQESGRGRRRRARASDRRTRLFASTLSGCPFRLGRHRWLGPKQRGLRWPEPGGVERSSWAASSASWSPT
jgi:hypothetical protein